ncbi:LysR family transcriptional regulator [Ruficoccus amylovorans]|uniref:LysR family transcriptional regulator n=1 Tax=Ruficoccus amylovorans TaxID=1804625 RepID=A0A842HGY3_9BACT|nr:LysR family transcriptional regulator [Ruficoccus amylovorans]MBC2595783.1 LysR family transcriptional regulator [Ruficoccus amylovorans]
MVNSLPKVDPEWLVTFLTIAECGGVLAASRAMHVSQPALSARLRRLEDAVGQALFDRSAQGMTLTEAGRRLLPVARKLPKVLREAVEAVDPAAGMRLAGPLRLSASTTLADFVLPQLLAEYARTRGVPGLELRVGNTDEVLGAVRSGRVALGAVEGLRRAAGLHLEPFANDEIIPVYSPDRLPRDLQKKLQKVTRVRDLAGLPLLWREPGSGTRRVVEDAFRRRGVPVSELRTDFVLGGTLALRGAALAGLGVAFLPRRTIGQELALGRLAVLEKPGLRVRRTFSWVMVSGTLPAELEAFRHWANARVRSDDAL